MKLEIRHLKLLVSISEEKSITKAGERLHLSQSALSHQLLDLEERLGTPLFLRLNKRMLPTEAGERLLASAREVLGELRRAEDEVTQLAAHKRGTLRLSTECYTCYHWLPSHLRAFHQRHPGVEVKIVLEATHQPLQFLFNGKLDLAIVSTRTADKRLLCRPLFRDELVALLPAAHPLAARPYLQARDFRDQHLFLYVTPKDSDLFRLLLSPAGVTPARVSQVPLTEAIIEMVKAGLGVSVLARWAVNEALQSGQVVARPLTRRGIHRQWSAALLRRNLVPPYLSDFITLLGEDALPLRLKI
ncbi:MAG TPA: LysR family transcriptional regulator [Blastocatellia bacterium]|nr:LysR family transcriptional regulator [Blastocatellia bacterium]